MPLKPGSDRATISSNIHELTVNGSRPRSHAQIVAIALSNADRHPHKAEGGGIGNAFAAGGIGSGTRTMSQMPHLQDVPHYGGLINSSIAGRTDRLPLRVPSESHVLPADTISGVGQGSTMAGSRLLMQALRTGPFNTPLPKVVHGPGPPRPPGQQRGFSDGGEADKVPILAAGGEFIIPEEDWAAVDDMDGETYSHRGVRSIGDGDTKLGHERLDEMIANIRSYASNYLRTAPPPKK